MCVVFRGVAFPECDVYSGHISLLLLFANICVAQRQDCPNCIPVTSLHPEIHVFTHRPRVCFFTESEILVEKRKVYPIGEALRGTIFNLKYTKRSKKKFAKMVCFRPSICEHPFLGHFFDVVSLQLKKRNSKLEEKKPREKKNNEKISKIFCGCTGVKPKAFSQRLATYQYTQLRSG